MPPHSNDDYDDNNTMTMTKTTTTTTIATTATATATATTVEAYHRRPAAQASSPQQAKKVAETLVRDTVRHLADVRNRPRSSL